MKRSGSASRGHLDGLQAICDSERFGVLRSPPKPLKAPKSARIQQSYLSWWNLLVECSCVSMVQVGSVLRCRGPRGRIEKGRSAG